MIPDKRVAEALGRLMGIPVDRLTGHITSPLPAFQPTDSLDTIELIMELEEEVGEEFDEDTMRWVMRYIEAIAVRPDGTRRSKPGPRPGDPDPLWDRDLDG
jgi:hypothetical protein